VYWVWLACLRKCPDSIVLCALEEATKLEERDPEHITLTSARLSKTLVANASRHSPIPQRLRLEPILQHNLKVVRPDQEDIHPQERQPGDHLSVRDALAARGDTATRRELHVRILALEEGLVNEGGVGGKVEVWADEEAGEVEPVVGERALVLCVCFAHCNVQRRTRNQGTRGAMGISRRVSPSATCRVPERKYSSK
jgi:hypothetical protein